MKATAKLTSKPAQKTIVEERKSLLVERYFTEIPSALRPLALRVRSLLLETAPDLVEELKYGTPFYLYKGWICFINPTKQHVDLGFTAGAELSDSFQLFDQRGLKQVRHIKIEGEEFLNEHRTEIANYIIEACVRNDTKKVNTGKAGEGAESSSSGFTRAKKNSPAPTVKL